MFTVLREFIIEKKLTYINMILMYINYGIKNAETLVPDFSIN